MGELSDATNQAALQRKLDEAVDARRMAAIDEYLRAVKGAEIGTRPAGVVRDVAWDKLLADVRNIGPTQPQLPEEQLAIQVAREKYADPSNDDIEIDDFPATSIGDGGIWVAAWVWVRDDDAAPFDDGDEDDDL